VYLHQGGKGLSSYKTKNMISNILSNFTSLEKSGYVCYASIKPCFSGQLNWVIISHLKSFITFQQNQLLYVTTWSAFSKLIWLIFLFIIFISSRKYIMQVDKWWSAKTVSVGIGTGSKFSSEWMEINRGNVNCFIYTL